MNQAVMDSNFNNQLVLNFHWLVLKFHWIFIIEYELVQDIIKKHVYMQKWEKNMPGGAVFFYSKTGFCPSYCQISTDLYKILHTPDDGLMMDGSLITDVFVCASKDQSWRQLPVRPHTSHWTVEEVDVLEWPVFHSLLLFSAWLTRLSSKLHIDWRHKARQDVLSAVRLSMWAGLMSNMVRLALSASLYRLRGRGAGRVSGQGGQNSARSAENSFAHPGFQFAHPAIRNGCPPCPPYRGGFKGKGLVGH